MTVSEGVVSNGRHNGICTEGRGTVKATLGLHPDWVAGFFSCWYPEGDVISRFSFTFGSGFTVLTSVFWEELNL